MATTATSASNPEFLPALVDGGLVVSGVDREGDVRVLGLPGIRSSSPPFSLRDLQHPWPTTPAASALSGVAAEDSSRRRRPPRCG